MSDINPEQKFDLVCHQCQESFQWPNRRRKYCSRKCEYKRFNERKSPNLGKTERICVWCSSSFPLTNRGDNARKYCSQKCAKKAYNKQQAAYRFENIGSEANKLYRQRTTAKHPHSDKIRNGICRDKTIDALGGMCVVPGCGKTKRVWLHVDFIPTTVGMKFRHPRHWAYIKNHLHQFRILCADHHYELTLTGAIEGTDITQPRHVPRRKAS